MTSTPNYFSDTPEDQAYLWNETGGAEPTAPPVQLLDYAGAKNPLSATLCTRCARVSYPAQARCVRCPDAAVEAVRLSGRAKLYAARFATRPGELSVGRVLLEEGFWVRALIVAPWQQSENLKTRLDHGPVDVEPALLSTQGIAIAAFKLREPYANESSAPIRAALPGVRPE